MNNGTNNDWFGGPTNNMGANGAGARKGKMRKANENNNNWFAPNNGTSK
jgi:hypothetical protein